MAWTDYSNTASGGWAFGNATNDTQVAVSTTAPLFPTVGTGSSVVRHINSVESITAPGFDDGYAPAGVPSPIYNNIDQGGGGGSTRPSSGMLYPRGTA